MPIAEIERQARYLARVNREAEPGITDVYWFPDEHEVRLVEVIRDVPPSEEEISPFYFRPDPGGQLPAPSGIAMVRPDEIGAKRLPPEWGDWTRARRINRDGQVE